jgi:hypothetical protein
MEVGTNFRVAIPKYPSADPNYRIVARQRSRYTHYYFYIRDQVLGPIALCVGSFLPFSITYYLNGHHCIEQQLRNAGIQFRKDDNAFLWLADVQALQTAADALSPKNLLNNKVDKWAEFCYPPSRAAVWASGVGCDDIGRRAAHGQGPSRHQRLRDR